VAKKVGAAAVRDICHDVATLESVAREAAKVAVRDLRHSVMTRKAATRMYATDTTNEEARMEDDVAVAAAWELIDGDEMEVEDDDDEVVEAEDGEERRAAVKLEERHWTKELIMAAAMLTAIELAEAEQAAQTEAEAERASN
jgi:hypothetical protein